MDKTTNHNPLKLPIPKKAMIGLGSLILVGWTIITVVLFVEYRKSKALLTEYSPIIERYKYIKNLGEQHRTLETMTFPDASLRILTGDSTAVRNLGEKTDYAVAILFTKNDCSSCLETELDLWQKFYTHNAEHLDVVAIAQITPQTTQEKIEKELGGLWKQPIYQDENEPSLFEHLNIIHTPTLLFYDRTTGKIIYAHLGMVGGRAKSEGFKQKVAAWLKLKGKMVNLDYDKS
ncbi:MAG: hypothetical protein J4F29_22765 [Candidatus Latescibacteria bacterium]|nr:hypothetical protein [Candidatus Latescibacterota bacterium]